MKLVHFMKGNTLSIGLKIEEGIVNLSEAAARLNLPFPETLDSLIRAEKEGANQTAILLAAIQSENLQNYLLVNETEIEFAPVVREPEKIVCVGLNYLLHIEEANMTIQESPVLFSKFNNALTGHEQAIPLPDVAFQFDYEAELVIIMGKEARNVSEIDALSFVYGYSIGNDITARDLQFTNSQWLLGKTLDSFAPIGPYLVTCDELETTNLSIECRVNGKLKQSSHTAKMIFGCAALISYISRYMTLKPGDVIFTGTPEGVIMGCSPDQQQWLKTGDEVEVTIEGIGTLKNRLI
ncbi:5-carboxymethyl-2-hydroxymuconate isomerase [Bacillus sp. FJAT-27264]|uniref:fumarylacetoacetate hydrolase family protein n=1 Tax=Paenibacillus sp. (strain DSM 101736 / FJAT-27264) TaxID=1850362 RepID=UPI000807C9C1|nr:fumarylacetoacetate hydrolase family protein [Bacillus sp. FJAT-27264]OBZ16275.1 5-carboxymethyl-2-hydroxymuconate isomerase [Bacillus sp. FJAT-27264]